MWIFRWGIHILKVSRCKIAFIIEKFKPQISNDSETVVSIRGHCYRLQIIGHTRLRKENNIVSGRVIIKNLHFGLEYKKGEAGAVSTFTQSGDKFILTLDVVVCNSILNLHQLIELIEIKTAGTFPTF